MATMNEDEAAIRDLLADGFSAISWSADAPPDWQRFFAPYLPGALLFPSARPVTPTSAAPFQTRMSEQRASGAMVDFEEAMIAADIQVFGTIAVASASFRMRVNKGSASEGVNMYLLVKEGGAWKIAAVAWDSATPERSLPASLRG